MNRLRAFFILLGSVALALPVSAYAADIPLLSPGWSLVPEACRACPCGFAGVLAIVQNLMNAGIGVAILFCVIILTWEGMLYITTPANPEARGKASNMLINAAVGLMIVLSAWLIVDFVMKILYNPNNAGWGPWNTILGDSDGKSCIEEAQNTKKLLTGGSIFVNIPAGTQTSSGVPSGSQTSGGSCSPATTGACAVSNMGVFGTAAAQASQVCFGESSGRPDSVNRDAVLADGTPYVFGLFQINITVNSVGGLNCKNAFKNVPKKGCQVSTCKSAASGVTVADKDLYNRCVAAAKNPAQSIQAAHDIYLQWHATWGAWDAAKGCGLAHLPVSGKVLAMMNLCEPEHS